MPHAGQPLFAAHGVQLVEAIGAAAPKMDATEQRIAVDFYRLLAGRGPASSDDLARATELSRERVEAALDSWSGVSLSASRSVVVGWSFPLNSAFLSVLLDRALIGLLLWVARSA